MTFRLYPDTKVTGNWPNYSGCQAIVSAINKVVNEKSSFTLVVDCASGVDTAALIELLKPLNWERIIKSEDYFIDSQLMDQQLKHFVTDDTLFGQAYYGHWSDFWDEKKTETLNKSFDGKTLVIGVSAGQLVKGDLLIYAQTTIWQDQLNWRQGGSVFHTADTTLNQSRKYKRAYFVDWRLDDIEKQQVLKQADFYLDFDNTQAPSMISGSALLAGVNQLTSQPFSPQPYFDSGLWGGQWMKKEFGLDPAKPNYAWCYNCMFPENCVALTYSDTTVHLPARMLPVIQGEDLLGEKGYARFGTEFPIRFDFLDTIQGGNLSLQVHPTTAYYQQHFGFPFTQDESYYFLQTAGDDTKMYLGCRENIDPQAMLNDLRRAQSGEIEFPAEKYINVIKVKQHDHCAIPAGTIHCSGANNLVLEISATPAIFTFKLYDWGRVDADGKPRPINIQRGSEVINWKHQTSWIEKYCTAPAVKTAQGDGWYEEHTGLAATEFIETRRTTASKQCLIKTDNEVQVVNLVAGTSAQIVSPTKQFEPFEIRYAETAVIPAKAGDYLLVPPNNTEVKLLRAYVKY